MQYSHNSHNDNQLVNPYALDLFGNLTLHELGVDLPALISFDGDLMYSSRYHTFEIVEAQSVMKAKCITL
jgi:hypothetical protein